MFTVKLPEEPLIEKVLITNNRECLDDLKTGFVEKWDRQHSNRIHIFNIAQRMTKFKVGHILVVSLSVFTLFVTVHVELLILQLCTGNVENNTNEAWTHRGSGYTSW